MQGSLGSELYLPSALRLTMTPAGPPTHASPVCQLARNLSVGTEICELR